MIEELLYQFNKLGFKSTGYLKTKEVYVSHSLYKFIQTDSFKEIPFYNNTNYNCAKNVGYIKYCYIPIIPDKNLLDFNVCFNFPFLIPQDLLFDMSSHDKLKYHKALEPFK